MEMITLAVRNANTGREYDFEVPPDQPIGEIALAIVRAMGWNSSRAWLVETPGRRAQGYLDDRATLAQLNLWNGTVLSFQEVDPSLRVQEQQLAGQPGHNFLYIGGNA